jgi:hypothetical protein
VEGVFLIGVDREQPGFDAARPKHVAAIMGGQWLQVSFDDFASVDIAQLVKVRVSGNACVHLIILSVVRMRQHSGWWLGFDLLDCDGVANAENAIQRNVLYRLVDRAPLIENINAFGFGNDATIQLAALAAQSNSDSHLIDPLGCVPVAATTV